MRSDMNHSFTCKLHHICLYSPDVEHHRPLAGTHFTVPRRVEGRVDLGCWLHTEIKCRLRESNPDTVTHPCINRAQRRLVNLVDRDQRRYHYATPPPRRPQCRREIAVWTKLASWSLTSLFSTNMAISEIKGLAWSAISNQWRKAIDILTSILAAFWFSSHPKGKGIEIGSFKLLR